jgi:hypothetical protein
MHDMSVSHSPQHRRLTVHLGSELVHFGIDTGKNFHRDIKATPTSTPDLPHCALPHARPAFDLIPSNLPDLLKLLHRLLHLQQLHSQV